MYSSFYAYTGCRVYGKSIPRRVSALCRDIFILPYK